MALAASCSVCVQVAMFSATFPPHIEGLAKKLLHKPIEVTVGERGKTASKIKQYVEVHNEQKKSAVQAQQANTAT